MKRSIILALFAAVLTVGAATAGTTTDQPATAANKDCTALKAQMGATAFANAYASFGACVSAYAPVERGNATSANAGCTAEQADTTFAASHSGKTFDQFYGTGKASKNAFGNCVSLKNKASQAAEQQGRLNPSRTCRAARTAMGTAVFNSTYGKNAKDVNAFGKCVSKTAHAQSANEQSAATACRAEQSDAGFAAAHSGKTFAQLYGTNADQSNAFGKCVVQKAHQASADQQQATVTAAKACQAELTSSGTTAFQQKYRTFGHCVSLKTHA